MRNVICISLFSIFVLLYSCKKNSATIPSLNGSWVIRSQIGGAWVSPSSGYLFSQAIQNSIRSLTNNDSRFRLELDKTGDFVFNIPEISSVGGNLTSSFNEYRGRFNTSGDSILHFVPDTSSLLKFTYGLPGLVPPFPKAGLVFFKLIGADSMELSQQWVSKNIYFPQDTNQIFNVCQTGLKRIQ